MESNQIPNYEFKLIEAQMETIRDLAKICLVPLLIYVYATKNNSVITVKTKYKITRNGFTDFMIIDQNGKHYNVNNSFFYWKWDSVEDWHKIPEDKDAAVHIKYYGYRIPFLGLFPNVYYTFVGIVF
jgi:hypothetical protein